MRMRQGCFRGGRVSGLVVLMAVTWGLWACAPDTGYNAYYSQNPPPHLNAGRLDEPGHAPFSPNSPGYLPARTADQKDGLVTKGGIAPPPPPSGPYP